MNETSGFAFSVEYYRDLIDKLNDRIDAALTLHASTKNLGGQVFCRECERGWPCPTVKALRGEE